MVRPPQLEPKGDFLAPMAAVTQLAKIMHRQSVLVE
jgi:hypothetical protein